MSAVLGPIAMLLLVAVAYMTGSPDAQTWIYNTVGFIAFGVFAARWWKERDQGFGPGAFLTIAFGFLALGDFTYFHHESLFGSPAGFPGIPDVLYQLGGFGVLAALGLMLKRVRADTADGVDAALIFTMLATVSWFFLIEPYATDPSLDVPSKVASVAFPATTVLVFGMVSWVVLARPRLTPTSVWLIAGFALYYGADVIYVRQAIDGTYVGGWIDLGWVLGYWSWAIAGRCRSPILGDAPGRRPVLDRKRILWLASAGLLGPAVLFVSSRNRIDIDARELVAGCVVLFFLALVRMALFASALDRQRVELVGLVAQLEDADMDRRKLLTAVLTSSESERSRLAAELHDGSIQHLSAINLELELALMALAESDVAQANDCISSAQEGVQKEVASLRTVMRELRPPALHESGLQAAMEDHGRAFQEREGVTCVIHCDAGAAVESFEATILYRVFQEAVGRSGLNPHVKVVHVSVAENDGHIVLEMADDGAAVDAGRPTAHDLALEALRERVEVAGGRLEIAVDPSVGTHLKAVLPSTGKEVADLETETTPVGR